MYATTSPFSCAVRLTKRRYRFDVALSIAVSSFQKKSVGGLTLGLTYSLWNSCRKKIISWISSYTERKLFRGFLYEQKENHFADFHLHRKEIISYISILTERKFDGFVNSTKFESLIRQMINCNIL